MKITQLDIEGFRSLKNVTWKPGDLNVIIGPNGSGKSNLLRLLELISEAAQQRLGKHIQKAGGISPLLWDGATDKIRYKLSLASESNGADVTYINQLLRLGRGSTYRIEQESLKFRSDSNLGFVRTHTGAEFFAEGVGEVRPFDLLKEEETFLPFLASIGMAGSPTTPHQTSIHWPVYVLQQVLNEWYIYHDVRFDQLAEVRQSAPVSRLDSRVSPDGQNLINVLHTFYSEDRDFKRQVNSVMRAAFGDDFEELIFAPLYDQRIQMRVRWKTLKTDQPAADLSDGTLRFLFLLAALATPNPPTLVVIDEPETGLHPSMLPLVAELAVDAAERTQVVFTTHSDLFLDAFRETETRPTTTVARWGNGETTLTTLADEDLEYWLKDYSLGKMYRSGELESLA